MFWACFFIISLWSSLFTFDGFLLNSLRFSDISSSNSSIHSSSNQYLGFSAKCSNSVVHGNNEFLRQEQSELISSANNFYEPLACPNLVAYSDQSETKINDKERKIRRGSHHCIPNTKYLNDYISPIISPNLLCRALSSKRYVSSSIDTALVALYDAHKAGSEKFRGLFKNKTLDALWCSVKHFSTSKQMVGTLLSYIGSYGITYLLSRTLKRNPTGEIHYQRLFSMLCDRCKNLI